MEASSTWRYTRCSIICSCKVRTPKFSPVRNDKVSYDMSTGLFLIKPLNGMKCHRINVTSVVRWVLACLAQWKYMPQCSNSTYICVWEIYGWIIFLFFSFSGVFSRSLFFFFFDMRMYCLPSQLTNLQSHFVLKHLQQAWLESRLLSIV